MLRKSEFARLLATILFSIASSATIFSGTLPKIVFHDPYTVLRVIDSSLDIDTYWGQMDSMGVTDVVGVADSVSTNNAFGIKIWGQDSLLKVNGGKLDGYVHISHNIYLEAENNNPQLGYSWNPYSGGFPFDTLETSGRMWGNSSEAGEILDSDGAILGYKYPRQIFPQIRMMAYKHGTADTLLLIETVYYSFLDGQWNADSTYIHENDITTSHTWQTITLDSFITSNRSINVSVFWFGTDTVAIDKLDYSDIPGRTLAQFPIPDIDTAFLDYSNRINANNHGRYYPSDEPYAPQFWGQNLFDDRSSAIGAQHKVGAAVGWAYDLYDFIVDPLEIVGVSYPVNYGLDSATTSNPASIQVAYNGYINYMKDRVEELESGDAEFWMFTQAGSIYVYDPVNPTCGDSMRQVLRTPTENEMHMLAKLPFVYGARGYGWFPYPTHYRTDSVVASTWCDMQCQAELPNFSDTCLIKALEGLVDWDPDSMRYVPNARWYYARDIGITMDSFWTVLDSLNWVDGDNWEALGSISGCVIDSIYSTTFHKDSTYLEVGRYTSAGNKEYYFIANRRTLSSDSQDVTIEFHGREGLVRMIDMLSGDTLSAWDSLGVQSRISAHFAPAQARLFRVEFVESWSDTLLTSLQIPDYATFNLKGDVIVNSGDTLVIPEKSVVNIAYLVDSSNGGAGGGDDADLTELVVKGTLRVLGTLNDSVVLGTSSSDGWYGIRSVTGASVRMKYAHIKNAEIAVRLVGNHRDSLEHLWIEDPKYYGIHVIDNDTKCFIDNVVITHESGGTYGALFSGSDSLEINGLTTSGLTYGISMSTSYADMNSVSVVSSEVMQSTGMLMASAADAVINDLVIYNYETALSHTGSGSDVELTNSTIYGDSTKVESDSIKVAIYSSSKQGSLKIRNCCFGYTSHIILKSYQTATVDLGIDSTDMGANIFEQFASQGNAWPDTFLYQQGFLIQDHAAQYNYFEGTAIVDNADYDTSNATGSPSGECPWTPPPGQGSRVVTNDADQQAELPFTFKLDQNAPNPFNPTTEIAYSIEKTSHVSLKIFNILGQLVRELVDEVQDAGDHSVIWDSRDRNGNVVASGVYFYKLESSGSIANRKMLLIK